VEKTDLEIHLLLEAVYSRYGYDFREYAGEHIKRRLLHRMHLSGLKSISMLQHEVLHDEEFAGMLLQDLSITVTEMFRDPDFYSALRQHVIPLLATWSHLRIWHAGCATGEEVYSMAILLREEGLYDRVQIYATDINQRALHQAKEGIFPAESMKKYAASYRQSGAKGDFSNYYLARYDSAIMDQSLKKNIVWANHNLAMDSDFAEMHMIVCRNVLIYFNPDLQRKVHNLFCRSLVNGGVLCLGSKEDIRFTDLGNRFDTMSGLRYIYKKKYITKEPVS